MNAATVGGHCVDADTVGYPGCATVSNTQERHLWGEDGGTDGGTEGKMEEEIVVERDGDRRTGASHLKITTLSNNKKKNLDSNDNNNHDTIITIVLM